MHFFFFQTAKKLIQTHKDGDNQLENLQTSHADMNYFLGPDSETLMTNGNMIPLKFDVCARE